MAAGRGYRGYKGRRSGGKVFLTVLLLLVILAAAVVMLLQKQIVYDEMGNPRLELFGKDAPVQELQDPAELDLVIREPAVPEEVRAYCLPEQALTLDLWRQIWTEAEMRYGADCRSAAVTLKDREGTVYFDTGESVQGARHIHGDTTPALQELLEGDTAAPYAIGIISCFHDPYTANRQVEEMGLKNTGGYIFYDGNNSQWLDPAKSAAREYLCALAAEAAAMGFDEILLRDVSYPTRGKLDKIAYGETAKEENILTFLQEMQAALNPYGAALSIELPAEVLTKGEDAAAGLVLAEILPLVNRVYGAVEPGEAEAYSGLVQETGSKTVFVPVVSEYDPDRTGSYLLSES